MPADPPSDPSSRLQLLEWRPLHHKTLRGFATVPLTPPGLIIHDLLVHRSGESLFALMPGKPVFDKDDQICADEYGTRKYHPGAPART